MRRAAGLPETSPRPIRYPDPATRPKRPRAAAYADEARALDVRGASVPCNTVSQFNAAAVGKSAPMRRLYYVIPQFKV